MKGMAVYLKHIGIALIFLGLLAGCEFLIGPEGKPLSEATEGNITIQLGPGSDGAKTVSFPETEIAEFHYVLEAQKVGGAALDPWNFPKGTGQITLTFPLGDWTVTVKAYDPSNVHKATGRKTITVTPEGSTVHITMESTNAVLSNLSITGETGAGLSFIPEKTDYTVEFSASDIEITAVSSDTNASIKINGDSVDSGTAKKVGDFTIGETKTIPVVVTAQDKTTTKTYTITATRVSLKSDNANLSSIKVDNGLLSLFFPLTPGFSPRTTNYTVTVAWTSDIDITVATSDPKASVKINGDTVNSDPSDPSGALKTPKRISGLNPFGGTISIPIVVTAEDGTTKTYTVTATRYGY